MIKFCNSCKKELNKNECIRTDSIYIDKKLYFAVICKKCNNTLSETNRIKLIYRMTKIFNPTINLTVEEKELIK